MEYDSVLVNPTQTSLTRTKEVGTEALLTWLPHLPGTAIYLGYNNDVQNLDRTLCNRLMNGQCDSNNTRGAAVAELSPRTANRFLKVSYLLRF